MCPQVLESHPGEIWEKNTNITDAHTDNTIGTVTKGRVNENKDK